MLLIELFILSNEKYPLLMTYPSDRFIVFNNFTLFL